MNDKYGMNDKTDKADKTGKTDKADKTGKADHHNTGCLIIHGFGGNYDEISPLADHLKSRGYKVACPALAGHTGRRCDLKKAGYTDWIKSAERGFLDLAHRCQTVYIIGFSMGGLIAFNLALQHKVAGIVTINTPIYYWDVRKILSNIIKGLTGGGRAGSIGRSLTGGGLSGSIGRSLTGGGSAGAIGKGSSGGGRQQQQRAAETAAETVAESGRRQQAVADGSGRAVENGSGRAVAESGRRQQAVANGRGRAAADGSAHAAPAEGGFTPIRRYLRATVKFPLRALLNFRMLLSRTRPLISGITCPVLITQGLDDDTTRADSARYIYDRARSEVKHIKFYKNAGHLMLHSPAAGEVIRDIEEFITTHI